MDMSDTESEASNDEHYAYSKMTDSWYRIHDYEVAGDNGQIIANGKTEVDRDEVPEEQRQRVEERR